MTAALLGGITALLVLAVGGSRRSPRRAVTRSPAVHPHLRRGVVGIAGLVGVLVMPVLVVVVPAGWWGWRIRQQRAAVRAHQRAIRQALPDLVDLLRLATTAGLALPVAHPVVAAHVRAPVGPALADADVAARLGRPRADALLDALAPFGERAHALAHVLTDHLRYGVPLLPGLDRTGLELRLDRRRAAELDARRVPVRLLGPLVACVLPAFALLTVVPLLAASLDALPL